MTEIKTCGDRIDCQARLLVSCRIGDKGALHVTRTMSARPGISLGTVGRVRQEPAGLVGRGRTMFSYDHCCQGCGGGQQERNRQVTQNPQNGGKTPGAQHKISSCNMLCQGCADHLQNHRRQTNVGLVTREGMETHTMLPNSVKNMQIVS